MNNIQDAVITGSSPDTAMRELQTKYDGDSVQNNMIHAEPYGFTSEPFTDSKVDAVTLYYDDERNRGVVIAACDRRYRIVSMKQGEVALYDDKGRHVYLKRDGIEIDGVSDPITVTTTGNVIINANNVNVTTTANVNVNASAAVNVKASSVTIDAPSTTVTGLLAVQGGMTVAGGSGASVDGSLTTTGDVTASGISLTGHIHTGDSGGTTSAPL